MACVTESRADARVIPDPAFAGDDGSRRPGADAASGRVRRRARRRVRRGAGRAAARPAAGAGRRGARRGRVRRAGLAHDKTSDMADGAAARARRPAGAARVHRHRDRWPAWNPEARPVPVAAQLAARSALQDGAAALVVDLAGPVHVRRRGRRPPRPRGRAGRWRGSGRGAAWIRPAGESSASIPVLTDQFRRTRRRPSRSASGDQHDRLPPASTALHHRSSGPVPRPRPRCVRRSTVAMPRWCAHPWEASDWLPLATSGSLSLISDLLPGRDDDEPPATDHQEDTSAPSCVSTTGSGFPRSASLDPTARPSASCRPTRH